jgi:hypothetical protein
MRLRRKAGYCSLNERRMQLSSDTITKPPLAVSTARHAKWFENKHTAMVRACADRLHSHSRAEGASDRR